MKTCNHCILRRKYPNNYQFKDIWNSINFNDNFYNEKQVDHTKEIKCFDDKPVLQNLLAESDQIIKKEIDYSNFNQSAISEVDITNLYECFQGILAYIFYYSENKLNLTELEFYFSGGKNYNRSTVKKKPDKVNIMNIFNYDNLNYQFTIKNVNEAFFGLTFKRIQIKPQAYSIRIGSKSNSSSNLISFTFEGYDEELQKWDILDERINASELSKDGSFSMFYVHLNGKSYSSFKVTQKQPGSNGFWGFSIAGFDIHGIISMKENLNNYKNDGLAENHNKCTDLFEYDPIMDMATFLF